MKKKSVARPGWKDRWVAPILRYTIEPCSLKIAHWWHWGLFVGLPDHLVHVYGDEKAKPRNTLASDFWQTNFGWQTVVVFEPVNYTGPWHLGYWEPVTRQ
jgi:hypothetical protein